MKNRSISIQLFILSTFLFLSGCGIFSLHPLYHNKDLIVKTELIGTWQLENKSEMLIIDTLKDKKYEFVIMDKDDTVGFQMGLIQLDNQYFIDLFPLEDGTIFSDEKYDGLNNLFRNYIPAHSFMKIDFTQDQITLTEFDNKRLIDLFEKNQVRLAHEQPGEDDDYIVITAKTGDIQKFITRYAKDELAFIESENYHRL